MNGVSKMNKDRSDGKLLSSLQVSATLETRDKRLREEQSSNADETHDNEGGSVVKKKKARIVKDNGTPFPLIPLLNSGFFFGTNLSFVNRVALNHTRNLAQYSNKIKRFLQERCPPKMYYEMPRGLLQSGMAVEHGPATSEGPTDIYKKSRDVLWITIMKGGHVYVGQENQNAVDRSLETLRDKIVKWWNEVGMYRIPFHRSHEDYLLASGNLVDISLATPNFHLSSLFLRGAVLRSYMKHNNLFRSLDPSLNAGRFIWCIDTDSHADSSENDDGPRDGDASIVVHSSQEAFIEGRVY